MNPERAEQLYSKSLDTGLTPDEATELDQLLEDTECRREVDALKKSLELLEGLSKTKAPASLAGAVGQQIRERDVPASSPFIFGWVTAGIAALLAIVLLATREPTPQTPNIAETQQKGAGDGSTENGSTNPDQGVQEAVPEDTKRPDNLATHLRDPLEANLPQSPEIDAVTTRPRKIESGRIYIGPSNQFRNSGDDSTEAIQLERLSGPDMELHALDGARSGAALQTILSKAGATFTYSRSNNVFTFVVVLSRNRVPAVLAAIREATSLEIEATRELPNARPTAPTTLILQLRVE